jgi:hypothetical protein
MPAQFSVTGPRFGLLILGLSAHALGQLGGFNSITINGAVGQSFLDGLNNQGCWIAGAIANGSLNTTQSNPPHSRQISSGGPSRLVTKMRKGSPGPSISLLPKLGRLSRTRSSITTKRRWVARPGRMKWASGRTASKG